MRRVKVCVHHVDFPATSLSLDVDAIRRLYWTAGIDLELAEAADIPFDPADDPTFPYPSYVMHFGQSASDRGHLIIGRRCPRIGSTIAGELWDLDWRGVSAVYTESTYIAREGARGLLQSAAHEIGHMLNLGHDHASTFVSAMKQAEARRAGDVSASWAQAESEANHALASGQPTYYFPLTQPNDCYPLSLDERRELNGMPDSRVLPWGGKFEHEIET